jgi:hypothetical protein
MTSAATTYLERVYALNGPGLARVVEGVSIARSADEAAVLWRGKNSSCGFDYQDYAA